MINYDKEVIVKVFFHSNVTYGGIGYHSWIISANNEYVATVRHEVHLYLIIEDLIKSNPDKEVIVVGDIAP